VELWLALTSLGDFWLSIMATTIAVRWQCSDRGHGLWTRGCSVENASPSVAAKAISA